MLNAGQVKRGRRIVVAAECDDGAGIQRRGREHVVVRRGRCADGAVGADVDDSPLEITVGAFLLYLVGDGREDLGDAAWATPGDDVFSAAAGTF